MDIFTKYYKAKKLRGWLGGTKDGDFQVGSQLGNLTHGGFAGKEKRHLGRNKTSKYPQVWEALTYVALHVYSVRALFREWTIKSD